MRTVFLGGMKKKSWLKAGGTFEVFIQPNNLIQIKQILKFLETYDGKVYDFKKLNSSL